MRYLRERDGGEVRGERHARVSGSIASAGVGRGRRIATAAGGGAWSFLFTFASALEGQDGGAEIEGTLTSRVSSAVLSANHEYVRWSSD